MVARLRFIRRAKELGFSLRETLELLNLRVSPKTDCAEVKAAAESKITNIAKKIVDLENMRRAHEEISLTCSGDGPISKCPILNALEELKP